MNSLIKYNQDKQQKMAEPAKKRLASGKYRTERNSIQMDSRNVDKLPLAKTSKNSVDECNTLSTKSTM